MKILKTPNLKTLFSFHFAKLIETKTISPFNSFATKCSISIHFWFWKKNTSVFEIMHFLLSLL